ncbi:band 7 protein [Emticicia oligotrophica DSM 17448]|uniref:Band 7 protein n=1 Tax=Emticicia oligotrophica (strain DSM 17448 / CIP 109782 / MTCC 6937 / GPTSA100-15) TaxID=929562 RepID=A0ABN4ATY3_EMTOG|nr:SPFH domain-containing protein [Emticicia oligotrophica]AFK05252.1 band 7 protein [Emticicia oligotrophica DSM 17448]
MGAIIFIVFVVVILYLSVVVVQQGNVAVITVFGKYSRIMTPGLNFKIPFIEYVFRVISIQNRSAELQFQAITNDQANVYFKAMLLYTVKDNSEESIKNVAFKFIDQSNFMQALVRSIEGSIRSFVATKKQAEILGLRNEIVVDVKANLDHVLSDWGYHLIDLQINDITFDEEIVKSMARVVASNNLKAAAENEGQALLITKTKGAEADGNAIRISAEAEREAARLRGQGLAQFREEIAKGMAVAAAEMEKAHLDPSIILFSLWTETIRQVAQDGKGNVIFMDGSADGFDKTMKQMIAMNQNSENKMKGK